MSQDQISVEAQEVLEHLRQEFLANLPERIAQLETKILELEKSAPNVRRQRVEALARDVHSLKGAGGTFGYPIITTVCHQFEDHLQRLSANSLAGRIDHFLRYIDLLRDICKTVQNGGLDFVAHHETLHTLLICEQRENLRILITEASVTAARIYEALLINLPLTITVENDGLTALGRILHEPWDVIITSAELPTLNGPALIAASKLAGNRTNQILAILITSDKALKLKGDHAPDAIIHKTTQGQAELRRLIEERIRQRKTS